MITEECVTYDLDLITDQEEADTKIILHTKHILDGSRNNIAKTGSPSWDTDVVVLVGTLLSEDSERKVLDEGRGNKIFIMLLRKLRCLEVEKRHQ